MKILRLMSLLALVSIAHAEPLPFRQAVDLAVKRSAVVSAVEQNRAHRAYLEAARMYIPQVIAGSGLAYSWGFPLSIEGSAPAVLSVNAVGYLINFGQREVVRALEHVDGVELYEAELLDPVQHARGRRTLGGI